MQHLKQDQTVNAIVGINLGKNKNSADRFNDYIEGIKKFGCIADYLVINISRYTTYALYSLYIHHYHCSPNTPGLRNMQQKQILAELLSTLVKTRNELPGNRKPPLLLKLAPDLTTAEREEIAYVLKREECKVDGLIISNTTIERPSSLKNASNKTETGGLSGEPLKDMSTQMIADMYRMTGGMTIIGKVCGFRYNMHFKYNSSRCWGNINRERCI